MDAETIILMIVCLLLHVWAWHALQAHEGKIKDEDPTKWL